MASYVFTAADGAALHVGREGEGMPLLALHGGYSSRGEIEAILELVLPDAPAFERWTPDLPGMGESIGTSVESAEQVVDLLCELVDAEFGGRPFVLLGHSLGGFLARAVAARRASQVSAVALLCPLPAEPIAEPGGVVAVEAGAIDALDPRRRAEFEGYFVWHTAETVRRFRSGVAPSLDVYDGDIVGRIMESADFGIPDAADGVPTLVVLGRRDSLIGYRAQVAEAESWPRATVVVVDDAGHALPHEKPELVKALLADLLARAA
ncbi:alpha/beta fold hydrolase [Microbacterium sulfonylureivorans]|uniref:alpha/beta fold hydrolase n=1 Tax=Microbacterium sulfonylureivorans TaxID=2486854 RepID=UPI0013DF8950|nr:alpha/beta hydrolase [Microbacterium sulfonylureivorans]